MQIARIVPKTRTQKEEIFDYAIPPALLPHIRPRILVEIPFHGRKIEGIIVALKRKSQLKNVSLKPIGKIIDPEPVIDEAHLRLAEWMSGYYLAPLGKTIFENIVPPAKRLILKNSDDDIFPNSFQKEKSTNILVPKPILIYGGFELRKKIYHEEIKKTLIRHQSVIILVPDLTLIKYFPINEFQHDNEQIAAVIHAQLSKTDRWRTWKQIRDGQIRIIIGSKSALFTPANNLGLIIIDQEENESYKNERTPRFHALTCADELSKLTGANLLIGTLTPRINSYFKALKGIYRLKKVILKHIPKNVIVHLKEIPNIVSQSLQEKIDQNIAQKKKIILVLNRKGEGVKFACPDCGWILTCPKCELPMTPIPEQAYCFRCQYSQPFPENCPKCHNSNIKSFGLGIKKLEKFIKDFWPKARIMRVEASEKSFSAKNISKNWQIAIVTSFALKFNWPSIGLVAIIDADQSFNLPNFQAAENSFADFYKFLRLGEEGIIQTRFPENPFISALAKMDFERFFLDELALRRKYLFPPFSQLIRLLNKNKDENQGRESTKNIYLEIIAIKKKNNLKEVLVLGPSPAPFFKKRNFFRWQIILKILPPTNNQRLKNLNIFLKTLSKGWSVDVDPTELM